MFLSSTRIFEAAKTYSVDPDQTAPGVFLSSTKIFEAAKTNSEDPDPTAPHCLSLRLQIFQWTTKTYSFKS